MRVLTGMVMVLALIGLPVAPVVCDTLCPPVQAAAKDVQGPRLQSAHAPAPCHQAAPSAEAGAVALISDTAAASGMAARPHHACDHPVIVTARSTAGDLRVLPPVVLAIVLPHELALPVRRGLSQRADFTRPPPLAVGAFSPVLRI